jgi:hypothetical protein
LIFCANLPQNKCQFLFDENTEKLRCPDTDFSEGFICNTPSPSPSAVFIVLHRPVESKAVSVQLPSPERGANNDSSGQQATVSHPCAEAAFFKRKRKQMCPKTRETRAMLGSRLKIILAENGLTPQQPRKLLHVTPHRAVLDFRTGSGAVLSLPTAADHAGD